MYNIRLSFEETRRLIEVLILCIINGNLGRGDGYSYILNLNNPDFSFMLAYEGKTFQEAILKVLRERQGEGQYLSFEAWFQNGSRPLNLSQTRVILHENGSISITMSDGWTKEVHENVNKRLKQLRVRST